MGKHNLVVASFLACAALLGCASASFAAGEGDEASAPANPVRIAFVGDSMADGLWGGVARAIATDACMKAAVKLGRFGENGVGLARSDRFDWPGIIAQMFDRFHPDLVVVSVGLNDRQGIVRADKSRAAFNGPDYDAAYTALAEDILSKISAGGASAMIVGLPALRDAGADSDARNKNKLFQAAVASIGRPDVTYVPAWQLDPSLASDVFKGVGPGPDGGNAVLRAPDGVHFTSAGYDLVGRYLLPKIQHFVQSKVGSSAKDCTTQ